MPPTKNTSSWGTETAAYLANMNATKKEKGVISEFTKLGFAYARFPLQASPKQIRESNHLML